MTNLSMKPPTSTAHPLDPLSGDEIVKASRIAREALGNAHARIIAASLREPAKDMDSKDGGYIDESRKALVATYDKAAHLISDVIVDLELESALEVRPRPGYFAPLMTEDFAAGEELVREDPQWQAAMLRRGVTDFGLALIDVWPSGITGPDDWPGVAPARLARPLTWVRTAPDDNGYARPVEGLVVTIDLDSMRVLEVKDTGAVALPPHAGNYTPEQMASATNRPHYTSLRDDVLPLEITQPDGPSFTVDGWSVKWQKWQVRIGFNPREGVILHQIRYDDRGKTRPVIHRASLSEMVVPYGDPALIHWNKNVFDMGEVGLGFMSNALTLGCDCLGYIHYFDVVVNDNDGNAREIPQAICLHEEDHGIAWKHTDARAGLVEVRRSRRLVISSIATVGNYEYGFFWYLYTDGTVEYEVKLTGIIATGAIEAPNRPSWGTMVAPGLYGPNHQHIFNVRLDMAVDGPKNRVYEVDSVPEENPDLDPGLNAWSVRSTLIRNESEGARDVDYMSSRAWLISNSESTNEMGDEVAFKLMPGPSAPPMFKEGSFIHQRARFATHDLWVTAQHPDELFAAGDYPYQHPGVDGLPVYAEQGRSVVDTDVVVWYSFIAHHVVRPEDWPVMPVTYAGFHLKPFGFFDGNPALDLPVPGSTSSHCAPAPHCH